MRRTTGTIMLLALLAAPLALAGNAAKNAKNAKKDERGRPIEQLLVQLETIVAREEAKPTYDHALVGELAGLVKTYKKQVRPIRLEDLSKADRKRLEDEAKKEVAKEQKQKNAGGPGGRWANWQAKAVERLLDGVKLDDRQRAKVTDLLTEYTKDAAVALRNRDYKVLGDLKKNLERDLTPVIGRSKTNTIMNNLNRQYGGRGRWGH